MLAQAILVFTMTEIRIAVVADEHAVLPRPAPVRGKNLAKDRAPTAATWANLGEPGLDTRDLGEPGLDTRDLGEPGLDTRDLGTRTYSTPATWVSLASTPAT